jgi:P-type Cu+ transporter
VAYSCRKIRAVSPGVIDANNSADLVGKTQHEGKTLVLVSVNNRIVGVIGLLDTPKQEAREAIGELKLLGIAPVVLAGDNRMTAEEIARMVGIECVFAGVLPSDKVDIIKKLHHGRNKVAMIGDGIIDVLLLLQQTSE